MSASHEATRAMGRSERIAATLLVTLGLMVLGFALWFITRAPEAAVTTTTRPTPSVVLAVRDLSRIEGAEMHMERVIAMTDTQRVLFGATEAEDSILLVAAADVVAGVDLANLPEDAVVVDAVSGDVVITVPHAEVFSSRLDSARTFVHARDTDLLAERSNDLESRARAEAERTLEEAALEAGILTRAEASVSRTLTSLLNALGHERVTVEFE